MLRGQHSAWLSAYYDFHWHLVGNLGGDHRQRRDPEGDQRRDQQQ
jgi:hypothetical protein